MDFSKTKPSKNIVDRTNPTEMDRWLEEIATSLNPVTAARKVRSELIKNGYLKVPGSDMMAAEAERVVRERMNKRDELLARGMTLEEAERIVYELR